MLNETELTRGLEIQQRSYRLLSWLNSAIRRGFVSPKTAGEYISDSQTAKEWITEHFQNLPHDCRPESSDPKDIQVFANMLSTYLLSSFEIEELPGERYVPHNLRGSSYGSHFVANPHLHPKKLTRANKAQARKLKIGYVKQLAVERGNPIDDARASSILDDPDLKKLVAMAAYGEQIILRMKGRSSGPAILALWREFAWNTSGSPKRDFDLKAGHILKCESAIAAKICG